MMRMSTVLQRLGDLLPPADAALEVGAVLPQRDRRVFRLEALPQRRREGLAIRAGVGEEGAGRCVH